MKKTAVILATVLALSSGVLMQTVTATTIGESGVVSAEYIKLSATVDAIDYERRAITLKGPDGKAVTLRASKEVKRFGEITPGEPVIAEYLDEVAVIVRKPDGISHPGYLKEVSVTPRGKESDGLPVDTVEALGTVEAIDYTLRTVTLRTADGIVKTYKADRRVKKLKDIVKGDKVYVRVTEPLAVRIKKVKGER